MLNVSLVVENKAGKSVEGRGSMPLCSVWAWPSKVLTGADTEKAMMIHGERIAKIMNNYNEYGHPIDIAQDMEKTWEKAGVAVGKELGYAQEMPVMCSLVDSSPFEAALHDAYGKLHGKNVYDCYGSDYMNYDLSKYLDERFNSEYLDQYTLRQPKERMPLYHLIGAVDHLTLDEVKKPVGDGLPEILSEWIVRDGLTHLKIKLNGDDLKWDVERVVKVEKVASVTQAKLGVKEWVYSLDFNEKCQNVEYLMDFLAQVKEKSPLAMGRVQYIEQPTARDLKANPENKMHKVAKIKPVVIDESLTDYETLLLSREMGYSGVALKACKGQSGALLMGAAAQKFKLFLCVQDLTCPGFSFLHSAGIAARIPTIAAIEGNARQYLKPEAYRKWSELYPETFTVKKGTIRTGILTKPGLGH